MQAKYSDGAKIFLASLAACALISSALLVYLLSSQNNTPPAVHMDISNPDKETAQPFYACDASSLVATISDVDELKDIKEMSPLVSMCVVPIITGGFQVYSATLK